ncbi:hypothetical protein [Alkalimarinus alittae]|uniref:Uncharacterized protein n=1 Tax=Alkalimarinus alittae TaxID=2961619 RepID=A0ABY6N5F5_9ALTE|nr:hypothetical protein [Alkalimarinus alittae]UZE97270.1 hypothetical protein NKI27_05835 [Alkalimarinus alittae]
MNHLLATQILEAFQYKTMVVGHSPLLGGAAAICENGNIVVSWVDDESNLISETFDMAKLRNSKLAANSVFIENIKGEEVQVSFYETVPVSFQEFASDEESNTPIDNCYKCCGKTWELRSNSKSKSKCDVCEKEIEPFKCVRYPF